MNFKIHGYSKNIKKGHNFRLKFNFFMKSSKSHIHKGFSPQKLVAPDDPSLERTFRGHKV